MSEISKDTRIAVVGIIVEEMSAATVVNAVLHEFGNYIVGRLGVPYKSRGVNVISVVLDAPLDVINHMTGKLGMTKGLSAKTILAKV